MHTAEEHGLDDTLIERGWVLRLISYPVAGSQGPLKFKVNTETGEPRAEPVEGQNWAWVPFHSSDAILETVKSNGSLSLSKGAALPQRVEMEVLSLLSDPELSGKAYVPVWGWLSDSQSQAASWTQFLSILGISSRLDADEVTRLESRFLADPKMVITDLKTQFGGNPRIGDALHVFSEITDVVTRFGSMASPVGEHKREVHMAYLIAEERARLWQEGLRGKQLDKALSAFAATQSESAKFVRHREGLIARGYRGQRLRAKMTEYQMSDVSQRVKLARNLLTLAALYDLLGGVQIRGRLTADQDELKKRSPLKRMVDTMRSQRDEMRYGELREGEGTLNVGSQVATYKTYNPVLFKATQELWPTGRTAIGIGEDADLMKHIDDVGLYGSMLAYLQYVFMTASSEKAARKQIRDLSLTSVSKARAAKDVPSITQRKGHPHFGVLWGVGETAMDAAAKLQDFAADPQAFIREAKVEFTAQVYRKPKRPLKKLAERGKGSRVIADILTGKKVINPLDRLTRTEKWVVDRVLAEIFKETGDSTITLVDPGTGKMRTVQVLKLDSASTEEKDFLRMLAAGPLGTDQALRRWGKPLIKKLGQMGIIRATKTDITLTVTEGKALSLLKGSGKAHWAEELVPAYIEKFQRARRLPLTGHVDAGLMRALKNLAEGAYKPAEALPVLSIIPSRKETFKGRLDEQQRRLALIHKALGDV